MRHHRTRKHHRKHQRGGRSEDELIVDDSTQVNSGSVSDDSSLDTSVQNTEPSMTGGRRRGGRRRGGRRSGGSSSRSSDGGSRKGGRRRGGRRSRKGGFMAGFGSMLSEALVPIGLSYYTIKRSKRNRNKRGGRDDIA